MTIAWISDFPVEWLPDLPESLRGLPRQHPATWLSVLRSEFQQTPDVRLHVLALRSGVPKSISFQREGTTFHILKVPAGLRAPSLFWLDTLVLRRALGAIKPDLVHAWGTEKGAALIASRLGYPYLVTIQGLLTWYQSLVPLSAYERVMAQLEKVSLKRARTVTTESRFAVKYLRQRYPKLRVEQVEHAPSWLFHEVHRHPRADDLRIVAVGSICYRKGTDLLVQALDRVRREREFRVKLVGGIDPGFLETLRQRVSSELWSRIELKQGLLPADVAKELAGATILALPTRADTSPNAVKEAVVAGVPVVASEIGGIPDYVVPEENGLLFPSESIDGLARALHTAFQHPLFGRGSVEAARLASSRQYLSPALMKSRFLQCYQLAGSGRIQDRERNGAGTARPRAT